MKYVFIDTNIWLSLYQFTNDDLSQFEKLKAMLGKSIELIVPQQVSDEIIRNRESKISDALRDFDLKEPKYPAFCKGYDEFDTLRKDLSSIEKMFKDFKKKIQSDVMSEELPADNTIHSFFSLIELKPCDSYVEKAYHRYRIGNPPGKDNKYGDAINWECLLETVPNGRDLYFISGDKDYRSVISDDNMNPFLIKEWENRKNSKIHFYSTLVGFLKEHVKEIQLKAETEKQELIEDLYKSNSFTTTHGVIAELKKYSGWTELQIERLCSALEDNSQVSWIIEDSDIYEFYHSILSDIKGDELGDCATKRVISTMFITQNEIEKKAKNDYEADRDEIYEEYYNH
jgi:hypothetical protein